MIAMGFPVRGQIIDEAKKHSNIKVLNETGEFLYFVLCDAKFLIDYGHIIVCDCLRMRK